MRLYHTSDREIRKPDIHRGRKNADFGWGFYLSPDRDFTYRWARDNAVVNEYELEESGLTICRFSRSPEWFEYIFYNRRLQDRVEADVIIGPIANDTIFDTLGILSSGYLRPEDALRLLMIGPEYTQPYAWPPIWRYTGQMLRQAPQRMQLSASSKSPPKIDERWLSTMMR